MPREPTAAALGGGAPTRVVKRLVLATRPMFFTASVLPVLLGTGRGFRTAGALDPAALLLALAATVLVHAGVNVLNDVYDDASGADRINDGRIHPYTGGSRFIQNGVMSRREMRAWGLTLLALAAVPGVALVLLKGWGVLAFGLAGAGLGVLYSAPPVALGSRGLGEAAVGVGFGVLPVVGAAWLQSGSPDGDAVLLSLPLSLWIANVLLMNEVPDAEADGKAGKRTLPVILSAAETRRLYLAVNGLAVAAVVAAASAGLLAPWAAALPVALLAAAVAVAALVAARGIGPAAERRATARGIRLTLLIHLAGGLWLAGWIWFG